MGKGNGKLFHNIPENVRMRMEYLEEIDSKDRNDGTPRLKRLRQIPPETGKFVSLLAASAPKGKFIEIGTSAGYSTLWIALACKLLGSKITTFGAGPGFLGFHRLRDTRLGVGQLFLEFLPG